MADPSIVLPDPRLLAPIEDEMWTEAGVIPPDASAAVRGAPINPDKFFAHALRQAREYSLRDVNMASLSVDLILPEWPLERILAQQLATYTRYAICSISDSGGPVSRSSPLAACPTPMWCSRPSVSWRPSA